MSQPQFPGGFPGGELLPAMACQQMTDKRSWQTFDQLDFSFRQDVRGRWIFRFETGTGRGMPGPPDDGRACRLPDFRRRSGCVPAEPYPPLKQPRRIHIKKSLTMDPKHYSAFGRTNLSGFVRTTTAISRNRFMWPNRRVPAKLRACGCMTDICSVNC